MTARQLANDITYNTRMCAAGLQRGKLGKIYQSYQVRNAEDTAPAHPEHSVLVPMICGTSDRRVLLMMWRRSHGTGSYVVMLR